MGWGVGGRVWWQGQAHTARASGRTKEHLRCQATEAKAPTGSWGLVGGPHASSLCRLPPHTPSQAPSALTDSQRPLLSPWPPPMFPQGPGFTRSVVVRASETTSPTPQFGRRGD